SWCRKNFLNYLRLREWRDAHRQLTLICRELQLSGGKSRDGRQPEPVAAGPREAAATADGKLNAKLTQQAEASEAAQKAKGYAAVHKAILAGLLSHIGQKTEDGDYLGARQRRFWIHPSSVIGRKRPQWLMAAELMETT